MNTLTIFIIVGVVDPRGVFSYFDGYVFTKLSVFDSSCRKQYLFTLFFFFTIRAYTVLVTDAIYPLECKFNMSTINSWVQSGSASLENLLYSIVLVYCLASRWQVINFISRVLSLLEYNTKDLELVFTFLLYGT